VTGCSHTFDTGCGCGCGSPAACGCGRCRGQRDEAANRPGLASLAVGRSTYPAAFDRMRQRLSAAELPALRGLTARRTDPPLDPAVALLDAWASVGHVLDFYNERLANENYLRTCRHRGSAVELGRLVGYSPRPGVSADGYLAFTLDDLDPEATLLVPSGTRAYTQPGPGETMQAFETSEPLEGRPRWSSMRPRLNAPQLVGEGTLVLYFAGTATGIRQGDRLLISGPLGDQLRTAAKVEAQTEEKRTRVELDRDPEPPTPRAPVTLDTQVLKALLKQPTVSRLTKERIRLDPEVIFEQDSYAAYGLLASAYPELHGVLGAALGGTAHAEPTGEVVVRALRVRAALHGHNAPLFPVLDPESQVVTGYREWKATGAGPIPGNPEVDDDPQTPLGESEIALDAMYDGILEGSWVALVPPASSDPRSGGVFNVTSVRITTRTGFRMPARVTVLELDGFKRNEDEDAAVDRTTVVYAQSEVLELAEVPVRTGVCAGPIELDGYYPGLQPGRRVIVTGERSDLLPEETTPEETTPEETTADARPAVSGVTGTELVTISSVRHTRSQPASPEVTPDTQPDVPSTWDTVHTVLEFAEPQLQYCYRRASVRILGNIAHASHGESRAEVLGSGDASRPLQTFSLKQGPLTYIPADSPRGTSSTLEVRVEDLRWREGENPASIASGERSYVVLTDDDGATRVKFGLGARLPTGADNVRAFYRSGLGVAGNARASQISVLASRPNGVTGVTNPLAATGGVDRDDLDGIRQRVPVGLTALDRLVSATDLEDFARAFVGIGKARVTPMGTSTHHSLIVAAVDDAPLSPESALLANLRSALMLSGDLEPQAGDRMQTRGRPSVTIEISIRRALLLGIRARIGTLPDHLWESVHSRLRAALFAAFGFRSREIGQSPSPGEAMAVMQGVRGVAWVHLLAFGTIDAGEPGNPRPTAEVAAAAQQLLADAEVGALPPPPAVDVAADQIAYLSPEADGTLLLEQALDQEVSA
jgi:hypothetical protein